MKNAPGNFRGSLTARGAVLYCNRNEVVSTTNWLYIQPFEGSDTKHLRFCHIFSLYKSDKIREGTAPEAILRPFAVFNLLPVSGFDGGRMFFATLARRLSVRAAVTVLHCGTYLTLLFLFCLSSCLLLRYGQNLALFVLCAVLFAKIFLPAGSA